MTDAELAAYLEDNGYPDWLVQQGGAGLVKRWRQFVGHAERGFQGNLEEYRRALDIRGLIALATLDEQVRDEDHRFAELLVHRQSRVWESGVTTDPFWDYGYPGNAGTQLLDELHQEGLA